MAVLRVCPAWLAWGLDNPLRRWTQDPLRMLAPYLRAGMTALDVGCGPGYFTPAMAELVGPTGRVIAADLQEGMLNLIRAKIAGTALESRITLHECREDRIGLNVQVDFILAFYMVHEVPDKAVFLAELDSLLKPRGRLLIVEPLLHVSRRAFYETALIATSLGLTTVDEPRVFMSMAMVLEKG